MLIKKPADIPYSEVTPKNAYLNRRTFIAGAAAMGGAVVAGKFAWDAMQPAQVAGASTKLQYNKSKFSTSETPTQWKDITHYNNYYEFGTGKEEPGEYAGTLRTRPWTVAIEGLVKKPKTLDIDAIMK